MYYIQKYSNCWAIHDDDTGASRPLTEDETKTLTSEFPDLTDDAVRTVFTDAIKSINPKLMN